MGTNPQPSQQRGAASDPRHGQGRGEMIKGGRGAGPLHQVVFVVLVLAGVLAGFFLAGILLSGENSGARYVAYGVLGVVGLIAVFWVVRRRRSRQSLDEALRSRRSQNG